MNNTSQGSGAIGSRPLSLNTFLRRPVEWCPVVFQPSSRVPIQAADHWTFRPPAHRSFQPRTRLPFQRHWGQRAGMFLLPVRQLYHQTVVTQAIVVSPLKNLVGAALPSHGRPSFDNRELVAIPHDNSSPDDHCCYHTSLQRSIMVSMCSTSVASHRGRPQRSLLTSCSLLNIYMSLMPV